MKSYLPVLCVLTAFSVSACEDSAGSVQPVHKCQEGDDTCQHQTACEEGDDSCQHQTACEEGDDSCQQPPTECPDGDETCDEFDPELPECESPCTAHDLDCSGTTIMICKETENGCTDWEVKEDCGSGRHCNFETYTCADGCYEKCSPNTPKRCSDEGVMTCTEDENGCAVWNVSESCNETQFCDDSSFTCMACEPECSADIKCTEKGVSTCSINEDGCAVWTESPCAETKKCDPDTFECTTQCKNACEEGQTKCDKKGVYTCGNFDEDECLEWSAPTACGNQKQCSEDKKSCVCSTNCNAGDVECDGTSVKTCVKDGECNVWKSTPCGEGQRCLESTKACGFACGNDCEPFSIVFLPDTQNYSRPSKIANGKETPRSTTDNIYLKQTNWIKTHQKEYNIKYVLHLGDVTNFNLDSEWKVASAAHKVLEDANIPYLISTGNHDYRSYNIETKKDIYDGEYSRKRTKLGNYFKKSRFEGRSGFGGIYEGASMYGTFHVGELKFLLISLEYSARKDVVCWFDDLIKKYPDHYVIVTTHNILSRDSANNVKNYTGGAGLPYAANGVSGSQLANELYRRHNNVILAASGHVTGMEFHDAKGFGKNIYYEMLCDYQREMPIKTGGDKSASCDHTINAGNGWLKMITIDPKTVSNNALARSFTPLDKSSFYSKKQEFYCSENSAKSSLNFFSKSPSVSEPASFDKFSNSHNFTFSLDLATPAHDEYTVGDYGFGVREINNTMTGEQTAPAVAVNPQVGSFVAVWQDNSSTEDGKDKNGNENYDIAGRLFYSGGCAKGKQFTVNTTTKGTQLTPDVAMDKKGNFVVVWSDDHDGNGVTQLYMKGFDEKGKERFAEVTVNTDSKGNQNNPAIAMNADGDFVVAWEDGSEIAGQPQVFVRGFYADGTQKFAQFNVAGEPKGTREMPDIAMASDGSFVVTWADDGDGNKTYQLHARAYNADGTPKAKTFTVNTKSTRQQKNPSIAMTPSGDYFIAYEDNSADNKIYAINVRGFNSKNEEIFADQPVSASEYQQTSPSICVNKSGDAVVSWFGGTNRTKLNSNKEKVPIKATDVQKRIIKNGVLGKTTVKVSSIGYKNVKTENLDNTQKRMPAAACADNGQHVIVWREKLDKAAVSEIYGRGYNRIK